MAAEFKAPSHAERTARHAQSIAAVHASHEAAMARVADLRREATDGKISKLAAIESEHAEQHRLALVKSAHDVAAGLADVVAEFTASPSRQAASNLAARFRLLEASAIAASGAPLSRELGFAFAADLIAKNPSALPRFALIGAFNSTLLGALEACEAANRACRMSSGSSAPIVQQALESLERQIARIAAEGDRAPESTSAARWEAVRFSGSWQEAGRAVAAIEKAENAPRNAAAFEVTRKHHRALEILSSISSLMGAEQAEHSK